MSLFPKNAIDIARAWARGMRDTGPAQPAPATPKWHSPTHHIEALNSTTCGCGAEKRTGDYRCAPCTRSVQS